MNRCLQRAHVPEWKTKWNTSLIQKDPLRKQTKKKLQTNNLPTDDEEKINSTKKGRDLLLANNLRTVPCWTERMPQRIQRHRRVTSYRPGNSQPEEDQTENLAIALIDYKKAYDMVPQTWIINCLKMYKILHEVKIYRENSENLEGEIDSRREKLSLSEGPKRYISRRCYSYYS